MARFDVERLACCSRKLICVFFPLFWFDPISELGCGKLFYSMLEGGLSWSEVDNPRKHLVRNVSLCIAVRLVKSVKSVAKSVKSEECEGQGGCEEGGGC